MRTSRLAAIGPKAVVGASLNTPTFDPPAPPGGCHPRIIGEWLQTEARFLA